MKVPSQDVIKSIEYIFKGHNEYSKELIVWIDESIEDNLNSLLTERDTHNVARLQGSIAELKDLRNLISRHSK